MIVVGYLCVLGAIALLLAGLASEDQTLIWGSIAASALGGLAVVLVTVRRRRASRTAAGREAAGGKAAGGKAAGGKAAGGKSALSSAPPNFPAINRPPDRVPASRVSLGEGSGAHQAHEVDPPAATTAVTHSHRAKDSPSAQAPDARVPAAETPSGGAHGAQPPRDAPAAKLPSTESGRDEEVAPDLSDEPAEEDVDISDLLTVVDLEDAVFVVDLRPRYHLEGCLHLVNREVIALAVHEARQDGFTPCAGCGPDAVLAAASRDISSLAGAKHRANNPP